MHQQRPAPAARDQHRTADTTVNGEMELRQRFSSIGISPSSEWLEACLQYLRQQNQAADEDAILHQMLNTDLRDVVRCFEPPANDAGSVVQRNGSSPNTILRKSIDTSNRENQGGQSQSCKSILPQSFKCMVQIEELLDVSLNAEQRLTLGPASSSSPTPIGNQKKRCLKMLLSDGYNNEGNRHSNFDETIGAPIHIVATETEPIPSLSVHSKPGIKVVLSGPIIIRFGVLMLDQGNTTVLGGCIPNLIRVQKKAMDLAAKLAGVGIDPTFRALVWNPEAGMEDDQQDEGEGESGDIHVRQRPAAPPPQPRVDGTVANNPESNRLVGGNSVANATTSTGIGTGTGTGGANSNVARTQFSTASGNSISTVNPYQRKQPTQQNRVQKQSSTQHQRTHIPAENTASSTLTPAPRANPYNKRQDVPSSSGSTTNTNRSLSSSSQTPSNPYTSIRNPYAKNCTTSETSSVTQTPASASVQRNEMSARRPLQISDTVDLTSPDSTEIENMKPLQGEIQSERPMPKQNQDTFSGLSELNTKSPYSTPKLSSSTAVFQNLSPTALSEPLSFSELRKLLEKIVIDPDEYSQYEKRTFIVPCKFPKNKVDFKGFTIEKNKHYKKKSSKAEKVSRKECNFYLHLKMFKDAQAK